MEGGPLRTLLAVLFGAGIAASGQSFSVPPAEPTVLTAAVTYTCGPAEKEEIPLTRGTLISGTSAGWDLNSIPTIADGICSAQVENGKSQPFYLSFPVTEGN